MKKLTLGLAMLLSGYAGNSFAALPTGTSPCKVSVPSYDGGLTFGLTALYWKPFTSHLDYALSYPEDGDTLFNNGQYHNINNNYDWGFKANVGYIFPCSGNDINLAYTHWRTNPKNADDNVIVSPVASESNFGVFPITFTLPETVTIPIISPELALSFDLAEGTTFSFLYTPSLITHINARSKFENRTWDFNFGQHIAIGCNFHLRTFEGLRYSSLEHRLDIDQFGVSDMVMGETTPILVAVTGGLSVPGSLTPVFEVSGLTDFIRQKSEFDGIGPQFGLDLSYYLGAGFGVVGSLSSSLLVGEHESTYSERLDLTQNSVTLLGSDVPGGSTIIGPFSAPVIFETTAVPFVTTDLDEGISYKNPHQTRVVPNIDAKLGLDWTYQFCNSSRTTISIEGGYMISYYFNALERLSGKSATDPAFNANKTMDLSFEGPYVGVQVAL